MPPTSSISDAQYSATFVQKAKTEGCAKQELEHLKKSLSNKLHIEVMGKNIGDLIEDISKAEEIPVLKAKEKIEQIDQKIKALNDLKTRTQNIRDVAKLFNGVGVAYGEPAGAFAEPIAYLVSGDQDVVTAIVQPTAQPDQISINVTQLASQDVVMATQGIADPSAPLGWNGTLSLNGQAIPINATASMQQINSTINAYSDITGVVAHMTVADSGYYFSFYATHFAAPITVDTSALNGVTVPGQIPPTSTKTIDNLSAKVIFRDSGQVKTYTSNTVTDQVPGVTFSLSKIGQVTVGIKYDENTATQILMGVNNNSTTTTPSQDSAATNGFITNWNNFIDYFHSEEVYKGDITHQIHTYLQQAFLGQIPGIPDGQLKTLGSLGLSLNNEGKLEVDENIWNTNIKAKYLEVRNALGFNWTSTNPSFQLMQRPTLLHEQITGQPITITLTKASDGTLSATMECGTSIWTADVGTPIGSAVSIAGPADTPMENVKLVFSTLDHLANGTSTTTTLTMTQGYMDRLAGTLTTVFFEDKQEGNTLLNNRFDAEMIDLDHEKQDKTNKLKNIQDRKDRKIQIAIKKFQRLEIAYQQLQQAKDFVKTLQLTSLAAAAI
jgi:flagellar capping protein FliD